MTRQDFIADYNEMWQLKDFVNEHDAWEVLEDVYDSDQYSDWVWDAINNWDDNWESLASWLYDIPDSRDYDYFDLSDDPCGIGDYETDCWKERVLEWADDRDIWDDDDETFEIEEAPAEPPKPDDTEFIMLLAAYAN